jgi:aminoglycoside phosphotransferase (APT) family kinase protein
MAASKLTARSGLRDSRELRAQVGRALGERFGEERGVVELELRANPYRSGFAIHDLDVVLEDGTALELLAKNLSWQALKRTERLGRPSFLHDPLREIETYRRILAPAALETPTYYGSIADPDRDRFLLLMERVGGLQLADHGDFEVWEETARRLALMHERLAAVRASLPSETVGHLLGYDGDYYRLWKRRARRLVDQSPLDERLRGGLARLFSRYDSVVEQLLALPVTIVHGELYSFNVLIDGRGGALRVCPIDWEMAALAPRLVDLAGLIAGSWTAAEKRSLALVYHGAADVGDLWPVDEFLRALDWCRLHVAVQWIGWSKRPMRRRRWSSWVREALAVADELEL